MGASREGRRRSPVDCVAQAPGRGSHRPGHGHHEWSVTTMQERICSTDDCDLPVKYAGLGLCSRCYGRRRRTGSTSPPKRKTAAERFWAKVDKNGPVPERRPDLGPCWLWMGAKEQGYGRFAVGGQSSRHAVSAHRFAYEATARIPRGLELDHLCRNPSCVNPAHLEPVTHAENVRRGESGLARREQCALQTHCKHDHLFDEANTIIRKNGTRACRECRRRQSREAQRARRAQNTTEDADYADSTMATSETIDVLP